MRNETRTLKRDGNIFLGMAVFVLLASGAFFFSLIAAISLKLRKLKKTSIR